jgi:hypothetical protein
MMPFLPSDAHRRDCQRNGVTAPAAFEVAYIVSLRAGHAGNIHAIMTFVAARPFDWQQPLLNNQLAGAIIRLS